MIRGSALIARTTDAECARTYYHYASDEMRSITHLTDEAGEVLNRYGYDAWGVSVVCEEQVENRFRYTGEQFDAITKQYYLRATFYNPVVARLTQEDTYRGAGLNLYAYCANNPVGYVDSSGHQPQCVKDAAARYMAEGLGKEEAYQKAYQNHAKQKLANAASLPVQELIKLEERARILGLKADSSVNREKNPEAKMPDAEQRDGRESGADNIANATKLKEYYRQAEKYGTGSIKELDNGKFRFYEELKPARTKGEMAGARHVREWDPFTRNKRDWYETLDHAGNIRQVRPDPSVTGGVKVHYMFDSNRNYTGSWVPDK